MHIVGGSYTEHCIDPSRRALLGSGLRAALFNRDRLERFVTALHNDEQAALQATLRRGLENVEVVSRPHPIEFVYETSIARPHAYGVGADRLHLSASADDLLAFGMVEADLTLDAQRAVIDPQSSVPLADLARRSRIGELVVVANTREVTTLAGEPDPIRAAIAVRDDLNARAVVIKAGVAGCAMVTADGSTHFSPPYPTNRVWPIGSGDAFSAGFARHWFETSQLDAALTAGSRAAAAVCSTDQLTARSVDAMLDLSHLSLADLTRPPRVYLAASFATVHQRWLLRHVKRKMIDIGIEPFSPLHENGMLDGNPREIAAMDLAGLDSCEAILVLADGSRTGPWVEAGWATRHSIPVAIYTEDIIEDRYTMLVGTGAHVVTDLASAIYRAGWLALAARAQP